MISDTLEITRLLTRKTNLGDTRLEVSRESPLALGEAVLKLNRFSVTTNNITYAAFGESMGYWNFFPTGQADWGHMPVWGFADVLASRTPSIETGERFFGYFPIASHLRVQPIKITPGGFTDGATHRQGLPGVYNQYPRCSADPAYSRELEDFQALYRPLFITSYTLVDFLRDNDWFGAKRAVISSASSKTAYGAAFCLKDSGLALIGLTSARNSAFVERLGCYQSTVEYKALEGIVSDVPTIYLDFSGDEALRARIHRHFASALVHNCFAGSTQNPHFLRQLDLPGPIPKFFFAAQQLDKYTAAGQMKTFLNRFDEAQKAFFQLVSKEASPWIVVVEREGFAAASEVIANVSSGLSNPEEGNIIYLT
jgi:hypothetical protein